MKILIAVLFFVSSTLFAGNPNPVAKQKKTRASKVEGAASPTPTPVNYSVTVAWDANPEPGITGYRVLYGNVSHVYTQNQVVAGNVLTTVVQNLPAGTWFFALTASIGMLESLPSAEVSIILADRPSPPSGFHIVSSRLANISTRGQVELADKVLIGGFVVQGSDPKRLIARAIGPSLPGSDHLLNPELSIFNSSGNLIESNDDWRSAPNVQEIIDSNLRPLNDLESAVLRMFDPGSYTLIVSGHGNTTGVGLVEVYDLDRTP